MEVIMEHLVESHLGGYYVSSLDEEIITDVFFVYSNLSTYTDALDGKIEDPKEAFQRKMSKYNTN